MELEHEERDGSVVLTVAGRLDMVAAPLLRARIDHLVGAGLNRVVIDLGPTTFIDSTGLGAVVGGLKTTRQAGGDLRLANLSGQVRVVLGLTNLDRVFRAYETVDEAIGAHA